MSQTAYPNEMAAAIPGMVAQTADHDEYISRVADADVPFGRFVTFDAADEKVCQLPAVAGDVTDGFGFATADTSEVQNDDGYEAGDMVGILRRGYIWVECLTAAQAMTDRVYVVLGGADAGKVRNDSTGAELLPGARFDGTLAAAGLVKVELAPQT